MTVAKILDQYHTSLSGAAISTFLEKPSPKNQKFWWAGITVPDLNASIFTAGGNPDYNLTIDTLINI